MRKSNDRQPSPNQFVKTHLELLRQRDLTPGEKVVWLAVKAHCHGDSSECYPSVQRIAEVAGLGECWTREILQSLVSKGWLRVTARPGRSSVYEPILVGGTPRESPTPMEVPTPRESPRHPSGITAGRGMESPTRIDVLNRCTEKSTSHPKDAPGTQGGTSNRKAPKKTAQKKETDPRISRLIAYFCSEYERIVGHRYSVAGAKDGATFKALLKDHSEETLQSCIREFFADNDRWLDGKRSISVFRARINQYVQLLTRDTADTSWDREY